MRENESRAAASGGRRGGAHILRPMTAAAWKARAAGPTAALSGANQASWSHCSVSAARGRAVAWGHTPGGAAAAAAAAMQGARSAPNAAPPGPHLQHRQVVHGLLLPVDAAENDEKLLAPALAGVDRHRRVAAPRLGLVHIPRLHPPRPHRVEHHGPAAAALLVCRAQRGGGAKGTSAGGGGSAAAAAAAETTSGPDLSRSHLAVQRPLTLCVLPQAGPASCAE